jgi:hypothetical protein
VSANNLVLQLAFLFHLSCLLVPETVEKLFADLVKHSGDVPVSTEEMVNIQLALRGNVSKWYTCSKGGDQTDFFINIF